MKNPRTTVAGYLLIVAAVATVVAHLLGAGGGLGTQDLVALMSALTGVGLVGAQDGGH